MITDDSITKRTPGSRRRVMIVDGNKSRFQPVFDHLEQLGIDVYFTNDRQKVVSSAEAFEPDIIVMNVFMGSGTMLSQLRELKGILPKTRYIMVTTQMTRDNIREFIRSGASDCISDPFDPAILLRRLEYQMQDRDFVSPDDVKSTENVAPFYQLSYEVQKILSETRDPHEALHAALSRIQSVCSCNRVNVIRGNVEESSAYVVVSSDDVTFSNRDIDLEKYPEVREVLMSDSVLFVKDLSSNPLTQKIQENVKSIKIESILVIPVRYRAETFAVMSLRFPLMTEGINPLLMKTLFMVGMMIGSKIAGKDFARYFQDAQTKKAS